MEELNNSQRQLKKVAEKLGLSDSMFERLANPERFLKVNIPVRMDDGSIRSFIGYRSQHNSALGPYKGGIRFSTNVSEEEIMDLSMWMSWKTAIAGIPYGGSKGGINVDTTKLSLGELERLSRGYIRAIYKYIGPDIDVPAPDMYTTPQIMAWMVDEYSKLVGKWTPGAITGKPVGIGGSLGRTEATGQGGAFILEQLAKKENLKPGKTTVAVQGIGNVGYYFAKLAMELGFKVVAISDSRSAIYSNKGIDIEKVYKAKLKDGTLKKVKGVDQITNEDLLELDVDVLAPSAIENVITRENAHRIKTKHIIEMANGPIEPEADPILGKSGVLVVPDVLANLGGVTVSYFEWVQNRSGDYWEKNVVVEKLQKTIVRAFNDAFDSVGKYKVTMRMAVQMYAVEKIIKAMELKGI